MSSALARVIFFLYLCIAMIKSRKHLALCLLLLIGAWGNLGSNLWAAPESLSKDTSVTICEGSSFTWHGQTYTETGVYTDPYDPEFRLHLGVLAIPTIEVCEDQYILTGGSAQLEASGTLQYRWEPATSLNNNLIANPIATPSVTTTYTVYGYNVKLGNAVKNGDFELGDVYIETDFLKPTQRTYGTYSVQEDCRDRWRDAASQKDHTTGHGKYMVCDGAEQKNVVVWRQTVEVIPGNDYVFSAWVSSLYTSIQNNAVAKLQFFINGVQLGEIFDAPNQLNKWTCYYEQWNSGNNTTAVLEIKNQNTSPAGNDFGLDDITFYALAPCYSEKQVTVHITDIYESHFYPDCSSWVVDRGDEAGANITITTTVENGDCDDNTYVGHYKRGDKVTLVVHEDECHKFVRWSDGSLQKTREVTINRTPRTLNAVYKEIISTVTVVSPDRDQGLVTATITP